jgi:hypothetical protein
MAQQFVEGGSIIAQVEFRLEGVRVDPVIVRAFVRHPSGNLEEISFPSTHFVKVDIGLYELTVLADEPGTWAFRAVGTGTIDAVQEGVVNVISSNVI